MYKSTTFLRTEFSTWITDISTFPTNAFKLTAREGGLVAKQRVRRLRAAGHSCVSFQRFCYVIVETEFLRKRTCGELRSAAPVGTPHLITDTVNTDLFLQWLQLLDNHVTATNTDAVPLGSHSVICTLKPSRHFGPLSPRSHNNSTLTFCKSFQSASSTRELVCRT